ncbi:MAG TPA: cell division protein FtsQ/DivIB [Solirubrobacteraceae bacterium]|jgi:cell division protein FtsQ
MIPDGSTRVPPRLRSMRSPTGADGARLGFLRRGLPRRPFHANWMRPSLGADALRLPPAFRSLRPPPLSPRSRERLERVRAMRLRTKLTILALVPLVVIGGWLLLRDSALFSVDRVALSGLGSDVQPVVSEDLMAAAHRETTTDFSLGALRSAVAPYTVIAGIRAQTHFPHGLTLEVKERHPVAHLQVGKHWYLLDSSGLIITGAIGAGLPVLHSDQLPTATRSRDSFVLLALRVISDGPAPLRARVVAVTVADGALTIYVHRGPKLIFGNGALPHAKWDAAAAVMAEASSRGASYIDVQVPSRPAAQVGDLATISASPANGSSADAPSGAASDPTLLDPALVQPSSYSSG